MATFRTIVAALFILMGLGIAAQFWRVRRAGLLMGALAYGGGGVLSLSLESWWPLLGGLAAAWALRGLGADPPTDLRFDLPVLERGQANDAGQLRKYLDAWLSRDPQVRLVTSPFVAEAWERGFRKSPHVPDDPAWSCASARAGWQQLAETDLRRLASLTREEAIGYLDRLDELSTPTLLRAGEATVQYDLPPAPSDYAFIERKIPDTRERAEYASAYVADAVLAARLRVLAWTFQQWHGERYDLPEKRRKTIR